MPLRPPDIDGTAAHAWMVPLDRARAWRREHYGEVPDEGLSNTHAMYYVQGTGFNPFWTWWLVALMDLEQRPRQPAPVFHYGVDAVSANALVRMGQLVQPARGLALPEHSLMIVQLDRAHGEPPVNGDGPFYPLKGAVPVELQWHGLTRAESKEVARFAVEALCAGRATGDPEIMPQRQWQEITVRLVNDYREGKFGGGRRKRLEIDPYTSRFTGREVEDV